MKQRALQVWAITMMMLRPAVRTPWLTVLVSMVPTSFIVAFQLIGGPELSRHALFGTLIVFSTNVGVVSLPQLVIAYRVRHLQDMFVASPVTAGMYAAAFRLSRLAWIGPGLSIVIGVLLWNGELAPVRLPEVIAIVIVTWLTGTMIGFTMATLLPSPYTIGTAANLAGMVITVLPPVYYPLELLPPVWRPLALLLPTTHAAQLVRIAGGVSLSSPSMIALHWAAILLTAGLCATVLLSKARWREA